MDEKMHADEQETIVEQVRRLLAEQFPDWASCPCARSRRPAPWLFRDPSQLG